MPLYDGQTRVTLHARHANGHSFNKDRYITNTLNNFEAALQAAIKKDIEQYKPEEVRVNKAQKIFRSLIFILSATGIFFLWRKLL